MHIPLALAVQTVTNSDVNDDVIDEGILDTEDLTNKVINAAIPTAIAVGSSYVAVRKGINDYSEKQRLLQEENSKFLAQQEKKKLYRSFLNHIANEAEYESGKLVIKNPYMLSKNLHNWQQLAFVDIPADLDVSITEFLKLLDNLFKSDEHITLSGKIPTESNFSMLEEKLEGLKDIMRRDLQK